MDSPPLAIVAMWRGHDLNDATHPPVLLAVEDLIVSYAVSADRRFGRAGDMRAVDGVSFTLGAGEVLALVGESGCGKTTLARGVAGLIRPASGRVLLCGDDVTGFGPGTSAGQRAALQMVFQDPFESLNPRKTVEATLAQPLRLNRIVAPQSRRVEVARLLDLVGLPAAAMQRYPHEFSGGQRQRIGIARALATRPEVLIADEAVSALDISIRAQLLALLRRLQRELRLAILFITHDLGVVRSFADRVIVMYLGQIVEQGPTASLFDAPRHPYTRALLAATPIADPVAARAAKRTLLGGDVPSLRAIPSGCRFHPRCPLAIARCGTEIPQSRSIAPATAVACHLVET